LARALLEALRYLDEVRPHLFRLHASTRHPEANDRVAQHLVDGRFSDVRAHGGVALS